MLKLRISNILKNEAVRHGGVAALERAITKIAHEGFLDRRKINNYLQSR